MYKYFDRSTYFTGTVGRNFELENRIHSSRRLCLRASVGRIERKFFFGLSCMRYRVGHAPRAQVFFAIVYLCHSVAGSHYDTLGVSKDASEEMIKSAYRRAALREHPDRQLKGAGKASRAAAAARMERLNEAYAILSDADKRRAYDQAGSNPFARQHHQYHSQHSYEPVVVKATVACTLEQLGGYAPISVSLNDAFGLPPGRQQLPPCVFYLPPGSVSRERHRFPLPQYGATLVVKTTFEAPHELFSRHGDDLEATIWLPAWQNLLAWRWLNIARRVRVRAVCGSLVDVCSAGQYVSPATGCIRRIAGYGMPIRSSVGAAAGSPYACMRGELRVHLKLRTLEQSAARYAVGVTTAVACGVALIKTAPWRSLLRPLLGIIPLGSKRRGKPVLSVWTGPGPGIGPPFRIWGRSQYYAYKVV